MFIIFKFLAIIFLALQISCGGTVSTSMDKKASPSAQTYLSDSASMKITAGATVIISWQNPETNIPEKIDIDISQDSGKTWQPITEGQNNTSSYAWQVPENPGMNFQVRVTGSDLSFTHISKSGDLTRFKCKAS